MTWVDDCGFVNYRRRAPENGGRYAEIGTAQNVRRVDNRHVVPYNAYLLLKYDCHINVVVATSATSIKYLFKVGDDFWMIMRFVIDGIVCLFAVPTQGFRPYCVLPEVL